MDRHVVRTPTIVLQLFVVLTSFATEILACLDFEFKCPNGDCVQDFTFCKKDETGEWSDTKIIGFTFGGFVLLMVVVFLLRYCCLRYGSTSQYEPLRQTNSFQHIPPESRVLPTDYQATGSSTYLHPAGYQYPPPSFEYGPPGGYNSTLQPARRDPATPDWYGPSGTCGSTLYHAQQVSATPAFQCGPSETYGSTMQPSESSAYRY